MGLRQSDPDLLQALTRLLPRPSRQPKSTRNLKTHLITRSLETLVYSNRALTLKRYLADIQGTNTYLWCSRQPSFAVFLRPKAVTRLRFSPNSI